MRPLALLAILILTTGAADQGASSQSAPSAEAPKKPGQWKRKSYGDPVTSWGHVESSADEDERGERAAGKENARLKAWIGEDIDALIAAWGAPKRRDVDQNGNDIYVFAHSGTVPTPAEGRAAPTPAASEASAPIKFSLNFYCDVSFRVRPNKRIVGWRYVGNNCNWDN